MPKLGLIAEDVAGVFPGAVARDVGGRSTAIAYGILRRLVVEEAAGRVGRAVGTVIEGAVGPAEE